MSTSLSAESLPSLSDLLRPGGLTEASLRRFGVAPHYFGLGFIQIKLTPDVRVHFWHPELTATVAEEELHDHRYDFRSHVVHGSTTHQVFEFLRDEAGNHEVVEVSCQPNDPRAPSVVARGVVQPVGSYTMVKGSSYEFPHTQFHRIVASECITVVERRAVVKPMARVIRPLQAAHVCPFSTPIPEERLWNYMVELLEDRVRMPNGGYHLKPFDRGVFGEASKIEEEMFEFLDALKQKNPVMALVELSDQVGAIRGWLANHHPSVSLEDLITMNDATTRAFLNGHRY